VFTGWGVGLTVRDLGGPSTVDWPVPEGVVDRPSRLTEVLPVAARSDAEIALELARLQPLKAMIAAYEASLVMGLAAHRAEDDVAGRSPIPGTSEFYVDELAVVTNSSARAAGQLAQSSYVLVERLPAVWAALADGELDWPRARVFVDVLGSTADGVAESVAPQVLPQATGLSLGKLRAALHRAVLAVDATSAQERRKRAERQADVRLYPTADGMAEFIAEMPAPLAAACWSTVDELAWMVKNDGDPRPIGQLRSGVLADLILRPWDTSGPTVTAHLTVVAPLSSLAAAAEPGAEPGEVDGQPITAEHVRELLAQLDAVCPGGLQAPTGGFQVAVTDAAGTLRATCSRRDLERIARRGCEVHPSAAHCGCAVLDSPPAVDRYVPTPAQRRFVKHRDRTCRHPNCGQPVARVDLDHVIPYPEGSTDCDNLCCLCRRHHRLKTLAPGWRFVLMPDCRLQVTTPSGVTRTTRPPGLRGRVEQRALPAPPAPAVEPPPF
jgi:hypothetical protein